jgi:hypothetical protein
MKLQFIKAPLILTFLFSVVLTGCLKDSYFDSGQSQAIYGSTTQVISLGINVQSPDNFTSYAYSNTFTDTTVDFLPVELGGPNNAGQDIKVTIDTSSAVLDSFNNRLDANGDPNPVGPGDLTFPSGVTIVDNVVTIPAGSRVGWLKISFVPHDYIGQDVALGFVIKSVSPASYTISGNLASGAIAIVIKNKYDGKYTLTQYSKGWGAYSGGIADDQTFTWPGSVIYATTGTGSNEIVTAQGGPLQTLFFANGSVSVYGAALPVYNLDVATDKLISIDNPAQDSRNRRFTVNPADDSRYDPATKTLYLSYFMDQDTRPQQTIKDTLVYIGPR